MASLAVTSAGQPSLSNPAFQAFTLLRVAFTAAPILFGLGKFTDWIVDCAALTLARLATAFPGTAFFGEQDA